MDWILLDDHEPVAETVVLAAHKVDGIWSYYIAEWDGHGFSDADEMWTIEPMPTHWAELVSPEEVVAK